MIKHLEPWERNWGIVALVVSALVVLLEMGCDCLTVAHPQMFSVIIGLACGVVSAVVILVLQRRHRASELYKKYAPLAGKYERREIGQDNTIDQNMIDKNVGLSIVLEYAGENAFNITADYWKNIGAQKRAHIEFVESNKMVATGRYKYVKGDDYMKPPHFGTYTIYRFQEDDKKLLVLFQHVFPRKNENNPDKNRGWEIWEKV